MRACACTTSRTSSGRKRGPPSCLRCRRTCGWTLGQTVRSSCIRRTSSSTRMRCATTPTSTPASTSSNIRAERADDRKPSYAKNMRLIGHSDQAGRSDGQQIMVRNGYAYIGHVCSKGFSVIDVRDPAKPEAVAYVQNPPNTWSLHLQVHDDLLLLVHGRDMFSQPEMADERNYYKPQSGSHGAHVSDQTRDWSAGMAVFDISKPTAPRQIGFMAVEGA